MPQPQPNTHGPVLSRLKSQLGHGTVEVPRESRLAVSFAGSKEWTEAILIGFDAAATHLGHERKTSVEVIGDSAGLYRAVEAMHCEFPGGISAQ